MSDLATLFDTDPLGLTKDDCTEIVRAYREAQHKFMIAGDMKAGSAKKVKEPKPKIENLDEFFKDLDL